MNPMDQARMESVPVYDPRDIELADLVNYVRALIRLHDMTPVAMRRGLSYSLVFAYNMVQAAVLYQIIGPNRGLGVDVWRASYVFIVGKEPGTGIHRPRCTGFTKTQERCKRNAWPGLDHCFQHADEKERDQHAWDEARWEEHYTAMKREMNLIWLLNDLEERYRKEPK